MTRTKPQDVGGFELDTGGVVRMAERAPGSINRHVWRWSDLLPFEQGYGGAMARELYERLIREGWTHEAALAAAAFRNWSPSTLAAIRKDCSAFMKERRVTDLRAEGERFWKARQIGAHIVYPPLTLSLGDDGLVYAGVTG